MEDSSLHWEMEEEYYPSAEERSGKVSWIFNKGLVFGKKVLMTGMLITSAPFVLPPLVAISALSVAASVPSGLFLASYACSEKVMSSLLPGSSPLSQFLLGYDDVIQNDQPEEEQDVGFEQDIDMEKEEQEQIDDTKRRVEMRIELPVMRASETVEEKGHDEKYNLGTMSGNAKSNLAVNELEENVVLKMETDHEKDDEFGRNENTIEVRDVAVMESGGHGSIEEGELARSEATGLIEKFRDENVDEGKQVIIDETAEEMDMPIEAKSAGRKGKRKGRKKGKINELELPKQIEEIKNDSAKRDSEAAVKVEATTISTTETYEGKVQTSDNGGAKAPRKIHHSGRFTEEKPGLKGVSSPTKKEGVDGEADIRKQIDAMKAIVGYSGTPKTHVSCFEELKALYLFTGVEPPESFKDPSNIEELSHKLKFLMSIVGVK